MELMVEIIGMKCFKGTIDGKSMDSGVMYGIVKLDERHNRIDETGTNWKFGHAVEEWKMPTSEHVMRLKHLNPSIKRPVPVRLEIERVSNGRESQDVVVDVVPVNAPAPQAGEPQGKASAAPAQAGKASASTSAAVPA